MILCGMLSLTYGYGSIRISFYTCLSFIIMTKWYYPYHLHHYCILCIITDSKKKIFFSIVLVSYINLIMIGSLWFEHNNSSTQMRRLTKPALTRLFSDFFFIKYSTIKQRISDLNGCDRFDQISFKLIALDRSANSLFCNLYKPNLYNIDEYIYGNTIWHNLNMHPFNLYIL